MVEGRLFVENAGIGETVAQEGDEVGLCVFREIQRRTWGSVEIPAAVVEVHDLLERRHATVMEIRCGQGDVPETGCLESRRGGVAGARVVVGGPDAVVGEHPVCTVVDQGIAWIGRGYAHGSAYRGARELWNRVAGVATAAAIGGCVDEDREAPNFLRRQRAG